MQKFKNIVLCVSLLSSISLYGMRRNPKKFTPYNNFVSNSVLLNKNFYSSNYKQDDSRHTYFSDSSRAASDDNIIVVEEDTMTSITLITAHGKVYSQWPHKSTYKKSFNNFSEALKWYETWHKIKSDDESKNKRD